MPVVSIIIPAYNAEAYLAEAIDSVLAQTHPHHEIIVVDDGSTDGTADVAKQYGAALKYVHRDNGGEAAARNTGLEHATGQYILFLDADDLLLPDCLEHLVVYLDNHSDVGVVYSDGHYCDALKNPIERYSARRPGNYTGNVLGHYVISSLIGAIHCALIRHDVIRDHQITFDKSLIIGPDWDFWLQLSAVVQFGYVDLPLSLYRIHGSNTTSTTHNQKRINSLIQFRRKTMQYQFFDHLPDHTRANFFYILLIDLLGSRPVEQAETLTTSQFLALSADSRAWLLRMVAAGSIQRGDNRTARLRLRQSLGSRFGIKTAVLLALAHLPLPLTQRALTLWRRGSQRSDNDRVAEAFGV